MKVLNILASAFGTAGGVCLWVAVGAGVVLVFRAIKGLKKYDPHTNLFLLQMVLFFLAAGLMLLGAGVLFFAHALKAA